jgi:hypothetical protein
LVFLIKSLVCIAIVLFALQWRGVDQPAASPESPARGSAQKPSRRPSIDEGARDLVRTGTDAMIAAARDKCFSAPRDCAAALQRLQGPGRDR